MKYFTSFRGVTSAIILFLATFAAFPATAESSWNVSTLHYFGIADLSGNRPASGVILAGDGKLYGTTFQGGADDGGMIFRLNKDGRGFEIIHQFRAQQDDAHGYGPVAGLLEASDGKFYGTTTEGGTNDAGTVYSVNKDGSGFQVIYHLEMQDDGGSEPYGELVEGRDGLLYGSTRYGGSFESGSIFRLNKNGSGFEVIHEFDGSPEAYPEAPLLQGRDGAFYGTVNNQDSGQAGRLFKVNPDGGGYQVLHDFANAPHDGSGLFWKLMEGGDGSLYGTTQLGGPGTGGVIFKIKKDGTGYRVLKSFTEAKFELGEPFSPLRERNGAIYGMTRYGGPRDLGAIFSLSESGAGFRVVETFGSGASDVAFPLGAFAQDGNGDIFGGSANGGIANDGTIFRCRISGSHQILHAFNASGGDGSGPNSRLSLGTNGLLYGTTMTGGWFDKGTIFEVNPDGTGYQVFLNLQSHPSGVVADPANGNLYLTTTEASGRDQGTLYRVTTRGKLKVLHRFRGFPKDGASPSAPLLASDGMLYGRTFSGGTNGDGIIYRINTNGKKFQILRQLDGWNSDHTLTEGSDGMLYGVLDSISSGAQANTFNEQANAFKMSKDGTDFTILRALSVNSLGTAPAGPLLEGSDGLMYGTTETNSTLFIYRMDKNGNNFQVLHTFPSGGMTALEEGSDGAVYGINSGSGAVFRIQEDNLAFSVIATVETSEATAGLLKLPNGVLCGTIPRGGDLNVGRAFTLTPP